MSIIIKNAYMWEKSYDELIAYLNTISAKFPKNIYYNYIKKLPKSIIEQKTLQHHNGTFLYNAIKNETAMHESGYDLDLSAEFMVYQHNGKIIIQFFGNDVLLNFMDDIILPSYDYYDNSDKPENVSTEKWEERKNWWISLYFDYGTELAIHCGLSYQIYSDINAWKINQLYITDTENV
ncbi:MAG: hypothetical protein M0R51_14715 [Clostridia bacterium]|jgi:hypothetical protein|nr:hypothetical protein [Clostridia bacterium]